MNIRVISDFVSSFHTGADKHYEAGHACMPEVCSHDPGFLMESLINEIKGCIVLALAVMLICI